MLNMRVPNAGIYIIVRMPSNLIQSAWIGEEIMGAGLRVLSVPQLPQ